MKLLEALAGRNTGRPPVWFMRQAGRYLPEYRELRKIHLLETLFFTPELAAEVTIQPLKRFPLDAAILFSDITVIARGLGCSLSFSEGPVIVPQIGLEEVKKGLKAQPEAFSPIWKTVSLVKQEICVPLLGFCGAPFTVISYLVGGQELALLWLRSDPESFQKLFEVVEQLSLDLLRGQVEAGVDAVQVFDSWANSLTALEFKRWTLPFLKKVAQEISVPKLFFMRSLHRFFDLIQDVPIGLSLDAEISLVSMRQKTTRPLQGNLDPDLLLGPQDLLAGAVNELLDSMKDDPAFILNLGHGVKPSTPIRAIETILALVHKDRFPAEVLSGQS